LAKLAEADPKVVAITAAMTEGTGLSSFAEKFPDRFFDVGIAEQHAVTFAAGLANHGFRPVLAVYSTFLQRAVDQICHDVCLQNLPVTIAIDRAGVVGSDGPTHHGLFDISYLRSLPNMAILAPISTEELKAMLDWAKAQPRPVAIRYPRGSSSIALPDSPIAPIRIGEPEILLDGDDAAIVALGPMVEHALAASKELAHEGISAAVVNARFVKPLNERFYCKLAEKVKGFITIEDGAAAGGFGSALLELLLRTKPEKAANFAIIGFPDKFIEHGPRSALLRKYGLSPQGIIGAAKKVLANGVETSRGK